MCACDAESHAMGRDGRKGKAHRHRMMLLWKRYTRDVFFHLHPLVDRFFLVHSVCVDSIYSVLCVAL